MKRLAAVTMLAWGCSSEPVAVDPSPVRLAEAAIWSGDTLRLISADFHVNVARRAVIGSDTVSLVRLDDSTIATVLSDTSGVFPVSLLAPLRDLGTVTVHGFESIGLGPPLHGLLRQWPAGTARVVGVNGDSLVQFNLQSGVSSLLAPRGATNQTCADPVPALFSGADWILHANAGAVAATCDSPRRWTIGGPVAIDSLGGPLHCTEVIAPVASDHWVRGNGIGFFFQIVRSGGTLQGSNLGTFGAAPSTFTMSSSGHRFVPEGGRTDTLPIFNAQGLLQARLTGHRFFWDYSTAFSPDGSTLYATSLDALGPAAIPRLLAASSSTGQVTDSLALDGEALALAIDPSGTRAYIVEIAEPVPVLRVVSLPSLRTVAVLRTGSAAFAALRPPVGDDWGTFGTYTLVPSADKLYVVVARDGHSPCPGDASAPQPIVVARYSKLP